MIVLFDGQCRFCNASVIFISKRDPDNKFDFVSLQSDRGRELLKTHGFPESYRDSLLFIEDGQAYNRSTAALRIARHLPRPWSFASCFLAVPTPVRDIVYRLVSENRS